MTVMAQPLALLSVSRPSTVARLIGSYEVQVGFERVVQPPEETAVIP
ncbi:hypothetical protein ACWCQL_36250 [Streptomyces sp. NPDC002073]